MGFYKDSIRAWAIVHDQITAIRAIGLENCRSRVVDGGSVGSAREGTAESCHGLLNALVRAVVVCKRHVADEVGLDGLVG
jgi:hypothetical protein